MKVKYHKFTGSMPIIFVERFSDFATKIGCRREELEEGTEFDGGKYFRTIGFKGSPLKFAVFEDSMMRTLFGTRRNDIVDATLAMYVSEKKYPLNSKLSMNNAIKMTLENDAQGAYRILQKVYLNKFKVENPYHKIAIQEGFINEVPDKHLNEPGDAEKYKDSHTHVSGGEGNLYMVGKMPQEKAQEKAKKQGADAKLVKGKMVPLSPEEKKPLDGDKQKPQQEPKEPKKREVKIVKTDTGEEISPEELPTDTTGNAEQEKTGGGQITPDKVSDKNFDNMISAIKKSGNKSKEIDEVISLLEKAKKGEPISTAEAKFIGQYIRPTESPKNVYMTHSQVPGNPLEDFGKKGIKRNYDKIGNPTLNRLLKQLGIPEAVQTLTGSSKMKPEKIFIDENGDTRTTKVKMGAGSKGLTINGRTLKEKKIPDGSKFVDYYLQQGLSQEEAKSKAKNAIRALKKYNKGIEYFRNVIQSEGTDALSTIDIIPGVHPTTSENRRKLIDKAIDDTVLKMAQLTEGHNKEEIIKGLEKLKKANSDNFEQIMDEALHPLMTDKLLRDGGADLVEVISYVKALVNGYEAYMPAEGNWPLGDVLILPGEDTPLKTIEDMATHLDMIAVSLENQSVKKNAGAASAAKNKIEQSSFVDPPPGVKEDLQKMEGEIYDDIWNNNNLDKAEEAIYELYQKYGLDPKKYLKDPSAKQIDKVLKMNLKANPELDKKEHRRQLELEYLNGMLLQDVHNAYIDTQFYSNEVYKVQKNNFTTNRSNGVTKIAYMKYAFNNKYSKSGKPDTRIAGLMVNKDRMK